MARVLATAIAFAAGLVLHAAAAGAHRANDPPLFVPWNRIGDIALGEPRARVQAEYGNVGHGYHVIQRYGNTIQGYYQLHRSEVMFTFYGDRVGELAFVTPYYRTVDGFGVGSRIPLGPCHKTATNPCQHRWRGFIYNVRFKEDPCNCWVKVGLGPRSLPPTVANFFKPWFIIYLRHGRVDGFYFALKYVD
jgi:hypothetical protein